MDCQIIHDSIHARPGWTIEHVIEVNGILAGYGSVAIGGPWISSHALYEFYVRAEFRQRMLDLFTALLANCGAIVVETQTNDPILPIMLHTFGQNIRAEAILFADQFETQLAPEGSGFRSTQAEDSMSLTSLGLDNTAGWVVTLNGAIAGTGGVLYHYNRPYGDIYMNIAEPFRGRGLGAYLVQELKNVCRAAGGVPAARCNTANLASRRTLQKAGFVPCGNLIAADVVKSDAS
jgi:GNAT superfamily N-acetyltransferase